MQFVFNPVRTIQRQRFSFESSKLYNPFNKLATSTQSFYNNYRINEDIINYSSFVTRITAGVILLLKTERDLTSPRANLARKILK